MSHELSGEAVHELFAEIDVNGDGGVDFGEFKSLAGKSWFLDAYNGKMRAATQRGLNVQQWLNEDEMDEMDRQSEVDEEREELQREVNALREEQKQSVEARESAAK